MVCLLYIEKERRSVHLTRPVIARLYSWSTPILRLCKVTMKTKHQEAKHMNEYNE